MLGPRIPRQKAGDAHSCFWKSTLAIGRCSDQLPREGGPNLFAARSAKWYRAIWETDEASGEIFQQLGNLARESRRLTSMLLTIT